MRKQTKMVLVYGSSCPGPSLDFTTGIEKMKMWQSRAEIDGVATEKDMSGMDVPRDRRSSRKRSLVGSPVSECQSGRMKETGQIPCTRMQAKQAASERWIRSVDLSLLIQD
jgi:hypothetical protein